jgi:hypothetical protein
MNHPIFSVGDALVASRKQPKETTRVSPAKMWLEAML